MKCIVAIILLIVFIMGFSAIAEAADLLTTYFTTADVNVRKEPDINSDKLGIMNKGYGFEAESITHTDDGRAWVEVEWDGGHGFISDKYLSNGQRTYEEIIELYSPDTIRMQAIRDTESYAWASDDGPLSGFISKGETFDIDKVYVQSDGQAWAGYNNGSDSYYDYSFIDMNDLSGLLSETKITATMCFNDNVLIQNYIKWSGNLNPVYMVSKGTVVEYIEFFTMKSGEIFASFYIDDRDDWCVAPLRMLESIDN